MITDEAIAFLEAHQSMPNDDVGTLEEIEEWDAAFEFALALEPPDIRFVPLFLNSFPEHMEIEAYRNVRLLLQRYSADQVVPHLVLALGSHNPTIQMYAADFGLVHWDVRLVRPLIATLRSSPYGDARVSAASTLGAIGGGEATAALLDALKDEENQDVRETIEEVLAENLGIE